MLVTTATKATMVLKITKVTNNGNQSYPVATSLSGYALLNASQTAVNDLGGK
jgi:hypothetical protein